MENLLGGSNCNAAWNGMSSVILLTDEVAEPYLLWNQFKAGLCDDVKHKLLHMNHYQADQEIPEDDVYDYGLWDLNRILVGIGRSLASFPPIPLPQQQWAYRIPNPLLQAEQYDVDEMATLVDEQRAIFNLDKLLLLILSWSLLPTIRVIFSLFMLLVVVGRHFFVTLLLLRLEEEVR